MLSVIVPVYNEQEIIVGCIDQIHSHLDTWQIQHEIIIANNGSTDSTLEIVERLVEKDHRLSVVSCPTRGVGLAFRHAVELASCEYLVCLDADLSSDLLFLNMACDLLEHSDMVVGSKTMGRQRRTLIRILGSYCYILITQLVFRLAVSDFSVGSKAFRKSSILPALKYLDTWTGHTLELCLFLEVNRKRILQVGINCNDTRKSSFSLSYEGYYRYLHLYRSWKLISDERSWIYSCSSLD